MEARFIGIGGFKRKKVHTILLHSVIPAAVSVHGSPVPTQLLSHVLSESGLLCPSQVCLWAVVSNQVGPKPKRERWIGRERERDRGEEGKRGGEGRR